MNYIYCILCLAPIIIERKNWTDGSLSYERQISINIEILLNFLPSVWELKSRGNNLERVSPLLEASGGQGTNKKAR